MDGQMTFGSRQEFRQWLSSNHDTHPGIWVVLCKDGSVPTLTADEALREALCFGWIDGQMRRMDQSFYLKRFTPRRKGSKWSERNRGIANGLIEQGLMTEAGLFAIDRAQREGVWDVPKSLPPTEEHVATLVRALEGSPLALGNYRGMSPSVRATYAAFYNDAKTEAGRMRRLQRIVDRLNQNLGPM